MGLKPWEFESLTPKEFNLMLEGYLAKRKYKNIARAEALTMIINCCGYVDEKIEVQDLLGFNPYEQTDTLKYEGKAAALYDLQSIFAEMEVKESG